MLHSLERIKHEIGTKRSLNADIWCQFGTVLIRQPDEGIIYAFATDTCEIICAQHVDMNASYMLQIFARKTTAKR